MLRQALVYLLLSTLVVVFAKYIHILVVYVDLFFTYVNLKLTPVFKQTGWGLVIRKILVLSLLPAAITAIPAFVYRKIKGSDMPHFIATTWVIWTVIVLSDVLIR